MKRYGLPRNRRLIRNSQFRTIFDSRSCARDDMLVVYAAANDCGRPRLGVSVSSRCGGAVVRNRLKRLIKEAFRQSRNEIAASVDYVVMVSGTLAGQLAGSKGAGAAIRMVRLERIKQSFVTLARAAAEKERQSGSSPCPQPID